METIWQYLVRLHESGDQAALVQFYAPVAAFVILIVLLARHGRGRHLAKKVSARADELHQEIGELQAILDRMEETMLKDLEGALLKKIDARLEDIDARVHQLNTGQSDLVEKRTAELDGKVGQMAGEILSVRTQLQAAEDRLTGMWEGLEDIKGTLAEDRRGEILGMLESFDSTFAVVLDQMKTQLTEGLGRIEGIEGLLQERKRAQEELAAGGNGGGPEPASPRPVHEGKGSEDWLPQSGEFAIAGEGEEKDFFAENGGGGSQTQDAPEQ